MRFCLVDRCRAEALALSRPGRSERTLSENGLEKTDDQVELSSLVGMAAGALCKRRLWWGSLQGSVLRGGRMRGGKGRPTADRTCGYSSTVKTPVGAARPILPRRQLQPSEQHARSPPLTTTFLNSGIPTSFLEAS